MRDLCAWCVQFANKRAHREPSANSIIYTIRNLFFSVNKFCVHFQKKCECEFFLLWCAKLPPGGEIACVHKSKSTSIHYAQFTNFDVFMHNLHASHVVYNRLKNAEVYINQYVNFFLIFLHFFKTAFSLYFYKLYYQNL